MRTLGWIIVWFVCCFLKAEAQSSGFNNTFVILSTNGGSNTYYDLNANTGNLDFQNTFLGSFNPTTNSLTLKGAEHNVWKCGGCDLTGTSLYYRIYPTSAIGGSFNALSLPWTSGFNNGCGGQDQVWSAWGNNIDLLANLTQDTYYLELYSAANVTCSGGTVYASNSGANYKATFTITGQALPVELLSFSGGCEGEEVKLTWQTATEHNSDYFELEKSRDGMNWQVLATVDAAGNSTQLLNYETSDFHAMEGNNYYRLTQVDIDGTTKTYDVINVSCTGTTKGYFSAYPNPSSGSFQVILNDKQLIGSGSLIIKDTKGAALLNRNIEVKPGINMFSVSDMNLAPGVYYIQIVNGERATEVLKESIR